MKDYRTWWFFNNEVKFVLQDLCIDLAEKGKIEFRLVWGGTGNGLCIAEQLWAEREKLT